MGDNSHVWLGNINTTSLFHFIYHVRHALIAEKLNAAFAHAWGCLDDTVGAEVFGDYILVNREDPTQTVNQIVGPLKGGMKVCRLLMQHTEGR